MLKPSIIYFIGLILLINLPPIISEGDAAGDAAGHSEDSVSPGHGEEGFGSDNHNYLDASGDAISSKNSNGQLITAIVIHGQQQSIQQGCLAKNASLYIEMIAQNINVSITKMIETFDSLNETNNTISLTNLTSILDNIKNNTMTIKTIFISSANRLDYSFIVFIIFLTNFFI